MCNQATTTTSAKIVNPATVDQAANFGRDRQLVSFI